MLVEILSLGAALFVAVLIAVIVYHRGKHGNRI